MRSLKNLSRLSASKMFPLSIHLRPGKHFQLMSNSKFSVNGSVGNDPNISLFHHGVLRTEQSWGFREEGWRGRGAKDAWWAVAYTTLGRPIFHPGQMPLHHLFPVTGNPLGASHSHSHSLSSPTNRPAPPQSWRLRVWEGKDNSQAPSVGPERLRANPLGGWTAGSFLSASVTRCQGHMYFFLCSLKKHII